MNNHAQIGIIGLGAMGQGLALNIAEKGYRISVFNRHLDGVEENVVQDFMAKSEHRETMAGFDELELLMGVILITRTRIGACRI